MPIPFTPVSLGFNSQIEPWLSELHAKPAETIARFGITPAAYDGFIVDNEEAGSKTIRKELVTAEVMVSTILAIEEGSRKVRDGGGARPDPDLAKLIKDFLQMAAGWMVAEVALGITAPDQPSVKQPGQLIRRLYLALYSSKFRQRPDRGDFEEAPWNALLKAVNDGEGKFDQLLPHCRNLCGAVAEEFVAVLWDEIW